MQDQNYQEYVASFAHERIPERVVHAKGAGALGYFIVTNKLISKYTKSKVFEYGKKTPVVARFSTVMRELGSADTELDLRGLAVKFKTEDGNYDLLMLNTLNFNLRDPIIFPGLTRSRKRNPSTHLPDWDMYWDLTSGRPETTFNTFLIFSDLGFPKNIRHMSGFSINTFKWTGGSGGEPVYVRYHMISNQGKRLLSLETYRKLAGSDPNYFIRDLYNSIETKRYPSWTLNVQILTFKQTKELNFNPFDPTKILPTKDFPLIPIGEIILNQNPVDYFNEVEQVAFNPGNLVPGIEASPDRVFHGRVFAYGATQRHRLGKNLNQLPINSPLNISKVHSYQRDGFANIYGNGDGAPNYYPNTFKGPVVVDYANPAPYYEDGGDVIRIDQGDDDNFSQMREYLKSELSPGEERRTAKAIASTLSLASPRIQTLSLERNWDPVSKEFGNLLRKEIEAATTRRLRKLNTKTKANQRENPKIRK